MSHEPISIFAVAGAAANGLVEHAGKHTAGARECGEGCGIGCCEAMDSLRRVSLEQRFLAEAGEAFSSSLDYRETLNMVAHIAVGSIADLCIVDVAQKDGSLQRLAMEDGAGTPREILDLVLQEAPGGRSAPSVEEALRADEVRVIAHLEEADDDPLIQALRQVDVVSLIIAPMVTRGQRLGVILLASRNKEARYGRRAADLAAEVARRAALAVDNARLYEEARRAVRARDEMLSIVAHDLRNPLGVITMAVELMGELGGGDSRPAGERLEMIRRSASHMERLIQDLLDVNRIEAGRLRVDRRMESAAEIVREADAMLRPLAERASLVLESHVEPDLPPIAADRGRLLQAVGNLVGNAVKFTRPGGRIWLRAERAAEGVRFSVRDTGQGIAVEHLAHLFDPFWQAGADRRGIGLGLTITRGIVEAHAGWIEVDSTPGAGTEIAFTIPGAVA